MGCKCFVLVGLLSLLLVACAGTAAEPGPILPAETPTAVTIQSAPAVPTLQPTPTVSAEATRLLDQADGEMAKGNYDQVIALTSRAIENDPNALAAYTMRGLAKINKDVLQGCGANCADAWNDLRKGIELNPTSASSYMSAGYYWYKSGEPGLAMSNFILAIALDPKFAEAFTERGMPAYRIVDRNHTYLLDGWIKEYTAAIGRKDEAVWRWKRGAAYYAKGNYDEAIVDFTQAIALEAKSPGRYYANYYFLRGAAYRGRGLQAQALADLRMYLQLEQPNALERAIVEQWIQQ